MTRAAPKKPVGRPFPKGASGNPGGKPKGLAEVRALARSYTEDAICTLAEVMKDKKAAAAPRVAAATALLDRGWGKPLVPVLVDDTRPLGQVPADRLLAALKALDAGAIEGEAEDADGG